jgi:hypothetical protein
LKKIVDVRPYLMVKATDVYLLPFHPYILAHFNL